MLHAYQKKLTGKSVGIVFGSFAPLHQGHLDCIMRAKKENDGGVIVISCGLAHDKGGELMPHKRRYRYVREFFADDDLVAVYAINDDEIGAAPYPDGWEAWLDEFSKIYTEATESSIHYDHFVEFDKLGIPSDRPQRVWYVGDPNYAEDLHIRGEKAVLLDRVADNPICATMIRQNPIKHWDKITFPFRRLFSHNILICGTASEGKTTLVQDLGKYFNAPYSMEWPRKYMAESCVSDWELDGEDYIAFLQGQHTHNKEKINSPGNHGIFFADTDAMVTKMYAEYYSKDPTCALTPTEYEKVAVLADEITRKCRWDKIFLLGPTDGFVDDHTRFMNHSGMTERKELYALLVKNLKESGNWDKVTVLDGNFYENFRTVVNYVREVMNR